VKWCVNLDAILLNYDKIIGFEEEGLEQYEGPSLFLNGALSVKHDEDTYKKLFPFAKIEYIEGAGHYVHTDKPKSAALSIARFLDSLEK
jgi:pimeloyl-ACP methyl ester carboxylesterase